MSDPLRDLMDEAECHSWRSVRISPAQLGQLEWWIDVATGDDYRMFHAETLDEAARYAVYSLRGDA